MEGRSAAEALLGNGGKMGKQLGNSCDLMVISWDLMVISWDLMVISWDLYNDDFM